MVSSLRMSCRPLIEMCSRHGEECSVVRDSNFNLFIFVFEVKSFIDSSRFVSCDIIISLPDQSSRKIALKLTRYLLDSKKY